MVGKRILWLGFGKSTPSEVSSVQRCFGTVPARIPILSLMALTGRRSAEIFFSASFSLPREKLPYPALLFDGQLKTRQAPGTSSEPYLIPILANPKKLVQALDTLRSLKSFPSPEAVNTTTGPRAPQVRFRRFRLPRSTLETRPFAERLRRHLLPQIQTQKPDRRYLPRPNPRPQTPRSQCIPLRRTEL
jgi:hypothetical protein